MKKQWLLLLGLLILAIASFILNGVIQYQKQVRDPARIYGDWIELSAPPFQTQTITFSPTGVFRNYRLITTHFDFNGRIITFTTGKGKSVFHLSKDERTPQIFRLAPLPAGEGYIKDGFQPIDVAPQKRRALLSHALDKS